jgi:hypothetical protein
MDHIKAKFKKKLTLRLDNEEFIILANSLGFNGDKLYSYIDNNYLTEDTSVSFSKASVSNKEKNEEDNQINQVLKKIFDEMTDIKHIEFSLED